MADLGVQAPLASAEALPGRLRLVERGTETVEGFSAAMSPPQVIQNHLLPLQLHILPLTQSLRLRDHPLVQVILNQGPKPKPSPQAVQDTQNHCPAIRPLGPKIEPLPVTKNPQGTTGSSTGFSGGSKFDKRTIQEQRKKTAQESLKAYQSEQSKFKEPAYKVDQSKFESNPLYQKGKVYSGFDYNTHYNNRNNYYKSQGYQPPPYAYNAAPSFGMFDTLFLFWMLDHMSNKSAAATAYNHSDDPGYKKWRQEAENLSKDNADLKTKLNELDKQVNSMAGTPKDPGYLPKGVPPDVALAAGVLAAKKPEKPPLKLATGQEGGWYYKFGDIFKKDAEGLNVKLLPSPGSIDNFKMLIDGKADLGIVQSDALALMEKKMPGKKLISEQTSLFNEYLQLVANKDSGVKSIRDLDPKEKCNLYRACRFRLSPNMGSAVRKE